MTKGIIEKFLNNRCTEAELDEIIQWANTEAINEENKNLGFDIWNQYQVEDDLEYDEKLNILFDKIQQKIDISGTNNKIAERRIPGLSVFTTWLTRAAAFLLIPVVTFLLYTLSERNAESLKYTSLAIDSIEVVAPIGSRTVVHLSDGSDIHLNYGSKLKYPQVFTGEHREVILTGEGFFNVAHNPNKPFIVITEQLRVKALGTSFNVLAYPGDNIIETTLVDGKVLLERILQDGTIKNIGAMVPGQHINYMIESGSISSTTGNIEKYVAWKDGKVVFEDTPIVQIADRLSRMYNTDIEVDDDIKEYYYTVTFVDEPLFQILDLLTIATPITYKALPREKLANGTFSKQKIIIKRKN